VYTETLKRNAVLVTKTDDEWSCGYGLVGKREGEALFFHSDLADDPSLERVTGAIEPRAWTHLCGVVDARGSVRLYVNGVLRAETKSPSPSVALAYGPNAEKCSLHIGHRLWGRSKFGFVGLVAELRVWNVAKREADIATLMQGLSLDTASRRGLVLHMTFDPGMLDSVQGDGVRVVDLSGAGNHGTLVGNAKLARLAPPPVPPFAPSFSLRALCLSTMARQRIAAREKVAAAAAAARAERALHSQASITVAPRGFGDVPDAVPPGVVQPPVVGNGYLPIGGGEGGVGDGGNRLSGSNIPVVDMLKVSVQSLTFRLPGPAQLDVPVSERFLVSNTGVSRVAVVLPREQSTHRYVLTFDPATFTVKPGAAIEVKATITLLCTTMVHEHVRMGLFTEPSAQRKFKKKGENVPDAVQLLRIDIESELTTRLDYAELKHEERPIGEGSYGVVYRGEWRGLKVAIKQLKVQYMSKADIAEFLREVKMMERLRSPYIVNFIGAVLTEGHLALVTEFMELGSVKS